MEIIYSPKAVEDLKYWKNTGNKTIQKKIERLLNAIQENPYEGIGKPEPLKYKLSGAWSQRITQEHRLIYEIRDNSVVILNILSLRGHY